MSDYLSSPLAVSWGRGVSAADGEGVLEMKLWPAPPLRLPREVSAESTSPPTSFGERISDKPVIKCCIAPLNN